MHMSGQWGRNHVTVSVGGPAPGSGMVWGTGPLLPIRLPYDWQLWTLCGECEIQLMSPDEARDWGCCFNCKFRCPSSVNLAMRWSDLAVRAQGAALPQGPTACGGMLCRTCGREGILAWTSVTDFVGSYCQPCLLRRRRSAALRWRSLFRSLLSSNDLAGGLEVDK